MKNNFRMVIALSSVTIGLAAQLMCQAQSPASIPEGKSIQQTSAKSAAAQTAPQIEIAALEEPPTSLGTPVSDAASPSAAASDAASGATPALSSAVPAAASVSLPAKNDAVIKELGDMKKQFDQMAQMQAVIKARMASSRRTRYGRRDWRLVSAEKDAGALRSAETGGTVPTAVLDSWSSGPGSSRGGPGNSGFDTRRSPLRANRFRATGLG